MIEPSASPPLSERPDSRTRRTREQDEALLKEWAVEAMVGEPWYVTVRRETVWNLFEERDALRAQVSTLTAQLAARSRRSEQEADALIETYRATLGRATTSRSYELEAAVAAHKRARAALRAALLEPSTDAGEDARRDSERLRERSWAFSVVLAHIDLREMQRLVRTLGAAEATRFGDAVMSYGPEIKARDAARASAPGVSPEVSNG